MCMQPHKSLCHKYMEAVHKTHVRTHISNSGTSLCNGTEVEAVEGKVVEREKVKRSWGR